ncbi:MAG: hypothetical protein IJD93_07520 [Ruminococcus sp.]|nr:hypothetical protein [Ruminococcus sp.]
MDNSLLNPVKTVHRGKKLALSLIFGIPALVFSMACASFVTIMSLFGFTVVFTEKGLLPMAICLVIAYLNAMLAVLFAVLSQKLGMVTALNKVSLALSIASSTAGTLIFFTLVLGVIAQNTGIFI